MRIKRLAALGAAILGIATAAFAQDTVNGVVVDKKGNPLPGVKIEVPGTGIQTISDLDGTFTLDRSGIGKKKLVATYAGMNQQKKKIKDGMRIKMQEAGWFRQEPEKWNTFVNFILGVPTFPAWDRPKDDPALPLHDYLSYGLMIGRVKKFGYYVKFNSNFRFGYSEPYGDQELIKKLSMSYWSATAGGIVRLKSALHFYAGLGYVSYTPMFQGLTGDWYHPEEIDYSYNVSGLAIDIGYMLRIKKINISLGITVQPYSWKEKYGSDSGVERDVYCAGNFGIGYSF